MPMDPVTPAASGIELSGFAVHSSYRMNRSATHPPSDQASLLDHDHSKPESRTLREEVAQQEDSPKHSNTTLVIIASYLAAWSLAIVHYAFFRLIDGSDVSNAFTLRQSQVSTLSLLLITAFRTAIVGVLGACFTQYLWRLLRVKCLAVNLIDDLFQIRSNILGLANPKVFYQAPVPSLAATLSWLVPLATVYPPGALTIQSELHRYFTIVNASIMDPEPSQLSDFGIPRLLANIETGTWRHYIGYEAGYDRAVYYGPSVALSSMAKYVMFTGQIVPMAPLTGENSSHTLTFEGPRVQCHNLTAFNTLVEFKREIPLVVFNVTWSRHDLLGDQYGLELTHSKPVGFFPAPKKLDEECYGCGSGVWPPWDATVTMLVEHRTMQCDAYTTTYLVDFSYINGAQYVTYTTAAEERLQHRDYNSFKWNATETWELPDGTQEYKDWEAGLPTWKYRANSRAILDSVGRNLYYQFDRPIHRQDSNLTTGIHQIPNGTELQLGELSEYRNDEKNYTMLQDSVLNVHRFGQNRSYTFDPRTSLNITEASINALLANVTISALSLNTWYGNVNVSDTESRNVYRFSHPINLLLPYGLCLGLTLVFIILGLNALRLNGTPATDGGFLQIMMTTTGDTAMSREVKAGSLGGKHNAPKALLDMKVRFGELVNESEMSSKRFGFGTMEETVPLRKTR